MMRRQLFNMSILTFNSYFTVNNSIFSDNERPN